ncbi:terminase large subunit [Pectinatus frisingensis]|uniref:terminase large subunit n=1 Tax=Pectinatus frisingensis TaxID=865 RepID=UPI0018C47C4A|nr:terminase TerL endonuclease subunit [Pectinatus frisingensis]
MNYIIKYYNDICAGKITAGNKIRRVYKHLTDNINNPQGVFYFDEKKANRAIEFIETFCHLSKGKTGGKLIKLELWQKAAISAIFGFVDSNGLRQYREVLLLVGRKNGKSALESAIALYCLVADGESTPEIYSVATKREQARVVWDETVRMIKKSPEIHKYCKCRVGDIFCNINDGIYKPLASDSNTLDGLNVSCALIDELHAWKDSNLYDVVADGMTARQQPLIIMASTAGFIRENIYDLKYKQAEDTINGYYGIGDYKDNRFLPIVYELDNKEEWKKSDCWQKANPALGTIKDYQQLAEKVQRAKAGHKDVKDLLTKDFNVPETSSQSYLDWQDIKNEEIFSINELRPRYGIGGFDLSRTTDLTSACVIFRVPDDVHIYVLTKSWMTSDALEIREQEDKVPYRKWIEKDYLRICNGHIIDYHAIVDWFNEVQEKYDIYLYKVGYDSYGAGYLTKEMTDTYGEDTMDIVIQGAKTLSIPLQNLKAELKAHNIIYNNNPILAWCLANLRVKYDSNANLAPTKDRSAKTRDDAAMALLDAYTSYLRNLEDYLNMI